MFCFKIFRFNLNKIIGIFFWWGLFNKCNTTMYLKSLFKTISLILQIFKVMILYFFISNALKLEFKFLNSKSIYKHLKTEVIVITQALKVLNTKIFIFTNLFQIFNIDYLIKNETSFLFIQIFLYINFKSQYK